MLFQIHRVAAVGVALLVAMTGCTKTVDVPLDQIGTGSRDIKTPHRIHMADGSEYAVRKFIVDETTLTFTSSIHRIPDMGRHPCRLFCL